jgi:ArsR family transcriptional regulator
MDAPALFKALSDTTRLRCVVLLARHDELCVCELTHALALPQPKISHHLAALRKAGVVADRKEGLWIYYRIRDELPAWAREVITAAMQGTQQQSSFLQDATALGEMPNRPGGSCSS